MRPIPANPAQPAPAEVSETADRGSMTIYFIIGVLVAFACVALVVDGAGKVQAAEQADAVAGEAARSGANALEFQPKKIDDIQLRYYRVRQAAETYAGAAGLSSTVTVNRHTVTVTTRGTYKPTFLGALGIGPLTVTGHATAQLVPGGGTP